MQLVLSGTFFFDFIFVHEIKEINEIKTCMHSSLMRILFSKSGVQISDFQF